MTVEVYIVKHNIDDLYYGSRSWGGLVPLKDAKIFSKKNTAAACAARWMDCSVIPCTLVPHYEQAQAVITDSKRKK